MKIKYLLQNKMEFLKCFYGINKFVPVLQHFCKTNSNRNSIKLVSNFRTYQDTQPACNPELHNFPLCSCLLHEMVHHRYGSLTGIPQHKSQNNQSNLSILTTCHQLKPKFMFALQVSFRHNIYVVYTSSYRLHNLIDFWPTHNQFSSNAFSN